MSYVTWMSVGLCVAAFVAVLCEPANPQPTRCLSLCLRSETEDSCQRCRLRVPMRFGKRYDIGDTREDSPFDSQLKQDPSTNIDQSMDKQGQSESDSLVDQYPNNWLFRLWPEAPKRWHVLAIKK